MWSIQDSLPRHRAGWGRKERGYGGANGRDPAQVLHGPLRNGYFLTCQNNISKADKIPLEQCLSTGELCSPFLTKEHCPTTVLLPFPDRSPQSQPGWKAHRESHLHALQATSPPSLNPQGWSKPLPARFTRFPDSKIMSNLKTGTGSYLFLTNKRTTNGLHEENAHLLITINVTSTMLSPFQSFHSG